MEVLSRLQNTTIFADGPRPLSVTNLFWQPIHLNKNKKQHSIYFTPGFNPVIHSPIPFIFTIHDLIHLVMPGQGKWAKKIYYELLMKSAAQRAEKILTVSDFSKKTIMEWTNLPDHKIIVVGNGVSKNLTPEGQRYDPGYPYLFHVGNTKIHKNIDRLLKAFAHAKIDSKIRLILTGQPTSNHHHIIKQNNLENRIIWSGVLSEEQLAEHYRGALAFIFPSLYEGFGIPVVEAMACGIPVITSNVASLPEIAGDAAVLMDPYQVDNITDGIEHIIHDSPLRNALIAKGLQRAKLFTWDKTAAIIQETLTQ